MPHKRNPVGAALLPMSAASRTPMLAATIVAALPQEHERALGGWQAEWPTLAALIETSGLGGAERWTRWRPASRSIPTPCRPTWTPPRRRCWPEARQTFLLAEKMGKQKAGKFVEAALAKRGPFVEAVPSRLSPNQLTARSSTAETSAAGEPVPVAQPAAEHRHARQGGQVVGVDWPGMRLAIQTGSAFRFAPAGFPARGRLRGIGW